MIFTYLLFVFLVLNGSSASDFTFTNLTVPESVQDFLASLNIKEKSPSKIPKLQMVNGKNSANTQFPYVAELTIAYTTGASPSVCSATLIGASWLLTARFCITSNIKNILASFGSSDRQSTTRTRIFVDSYVPYGDPDIALLHLQTPVTLSSTIKIIRLPAIPKEHFGYEGYDITSVGWGISGPGVYPRYLQFANFKILPKSRCNFNAYTFCCMAPYGGSSLSIGDYGGPSVILDSDGIETLVGINSGISKLTDGVYQVMTRVSSYIRWIQLITGIVYNKDSLVIPKGYSGYCYVTGSTFTSASNCFIMRIQTDGNIVIVSRANAVIWASNTAGKKTTALCMLSDGNLVLYNGNTPVWSTGTSNNPGAYAKIQNDGSLAILKAGTSTNPVWKTKSLTTYPAKCA